MRGTASLLAVLLLSVGSAVATSYYQNNGNVGYSGMNVLAFIDMNGVLGTIQFYQPYPRSPVTITVNLKGLDEYAEYYTWHIHEYPMNLVDVNNFPCTREQIGGHFDPTGQALIPPTSEYNERCANDTDACEVGDLAGKLGPLRSTTETQVFVDTRLDLYGPLSPLGRSVVVHRQGAGGRWTCGNLGYASPFSKSRVESVRYSFRGLFQGDILFRRVEGSGVSTFDTLLFANESLGVETAITWNLRRGTCDAPGAVYGSLSVQDDIEWVTRNCNRTTNHLECILGDLTAKCGPLIIGPTLGIIRDFCLDNQLGLVPSYTVTQYVLTLENSDGEILACAAHEVIPATKANVRGYTAGKLTYVFYNFRFQQRTVNSPTEIESYVVGQDCDEIIFTIRTNPVPEGGSCDVMLLGPVYERPGVRFETDGISSGGGQDTTDNSFIGSLSSKLRSFRTNRCRGLDLTPYLPLSDPFSIVGRALLLQRQDGTILGCSTINLY